jgi:hypothetical protein
MTTDDEKTQAAIKALAEGGAHTATFTIDVFRTPDGRRASRMQTTPGATIVDVDAALAGMESLARETLRRIEIARAADRMRVGEA